MCNAQLPGSELGTRPLHGNLDTYKQTIGYSNKLYLFLTPPLDRLRGIFSLHQVDRILHGLEFHPTNKHKE